ncbi:hypothetical protein HJD18_10555 [Thermoleophilia bacterium SCSIO 60948]|nr:hypothetical protein HJD18_10555 [Thermoleophilia bacterium SCSIO 60948]
MDFLIIFGMLALIVVILVVVSNGYPGSGADLVGYRSDRSYETEANLEALEVDQMVKAQNEYRRRRGEAKLTNEDLRRWVAEDDEARKRNPKVQALEEEFEEVDTPPPGSEGDDEPGAER